MPPVPVTVFWRPMCGHCDVLKRALARRDIAFEAIDIWEDRSQADVVKAATGGDEIVPTVRVGSDLFLVNPSIDQVVAAVAAA